ncbi:unnamed protein product [Chondrus crispus]|uniref:Uncharacterized protein n=1 Tax=Chondrus crispus TaxID=2769 RepID=R7QRS2_CHOCR|nr:unnamed protein product [Chondrus crispus]CDF40433.1 unnamed protein product [Chondrus crispus]|eukprot:XP_005710727.1 unnamed protein product [Chondrus crispus]
MLCLGKEFVQFVERGFGGRPERIVDQASESGEQGKDSQTKVSRQAAGDAARVGNVNLLQ